jgi:DNA polymerase-3 subunit beta
MFNDDDNDVELHIFDNKIIFKFDSIIMLSRIINGVYPDTSKLIPTEFSLIIKVNLREFYNAIDRASLLTNENEKNTIRFETQDDHVIISSNTPELGYVEVTIAIEKNSNDNLKIAFSSKYMLDALKSMECEEINLMFNGDIKPIIMKNPNNNDLLQLILPIRTY